MLFLDGVYEVDSEGTTAKFHVIEAPPYANETLAEGWVNQFQEAMNDDFNTPIALSVLFQLSHEVNKEKSPQLAYTLVYLAGILGLLQTQPDLFLQAGVSDTDMIEKLVNERLEARANRDFKRADEIRAILTDLGIELEDGATGTVWRVKTQIIEAGDKL